MAKSDWKTALILLGLLIVAVHYFFFVTQIRNNNECFTNLLKEQYDNQNLLTQEFYRVTVVEKSQDPADIDQVFKSHFDRIDALNEKFTCGQR